MSRPLPEPAAPGPEVGAAPTADPAAGAVDVLSQPDPVAAVLAAIDQGRTLLLRTSGSTGHPRLLVRDPETWVLSFDAVARLTGLGRGDRVWVPGPPQATMNLFAAALAHHCGAGLQPDPEGASHAHVTPRVLRQALDDALPVHGVRLTVAGDRLPRADRDRAVAAGAVVTHYYGAAELSFVAWGSHEEDLEVFPGVDADVRDGEIWVRSPYVCQGYVGEPGALRRAPDGFVTVGDRGALDGRRLWMLGRPEDRVLTGGATVQVADVERALQGLGRGELAVLGLPHADLGQVVTAALTDPDDAPLLREAAARLLDPAQRPRWWYAVETLPTGPAGKRDRTALRRLLTAGGGRRLAPGAEPGP